MCGFILQWLRAFYISMLDRNNFQKRIPSSYLSRISIPTIWKWLIKFCYRGVSFYDAYDRELWSNYNWALIFIYLLGTYFISFKTFACLLQSVSLVSCDTTYLSRRRCQSNKSSKRIWLMSVIVRHRCTGTISLSIRAVKALIVVRSVYFLYLCRVFLHCIRNICLLRLKVQELLVHE